MSKVKEKHFAPSDEVKKASKKFITALKAGKIKKEVLKNTSEDFNVEKVAKSIDSLSNRDEFIAIANQ